MACTWQGHPSYNSSTACALSRGVAFFEYALRVHANRTGSAVYTAPQLRGMQEVNTRVVSTGFSAGNLGQPLE